MILDLNETPVEYFIEDIFAIGKEEMAKISKKVMTGNLKDFEEYKYYTGKYNGIQVSLNIAKEVYNRSPNSLEKSIEESKFYEKK